MALLLVDPEPGEEAAADGGEHRVDRLGAGVGQRDGAAGALVVAAGVAQAVDDLAEDLARVAAERPDADRELEQVSRTRRSARTQSTLSNRTKKSATSAMMSGWLTSPHQLMTTSR